MIIIIVTVIINYIIAIMKKYKMMVNIVISK